MELELLRFFVNRFVLFVVVDFFFSQLQDAFVNPFGSSYRPK